MSLQGQGKMNTEHRVSIFVFECPDSAKQNGCSGRTRQHTGLSSVVRARALERPKQLRKISRRVLGFIEPHIL